MSATGSSRCQITSSSSSGWLMALVRSSWCFVPSRRATPAALRTRSAGGVVVADRERLIGSGVYSAIRATIV